MKVLLVQTKVTEIRVDLRQYWLLLKGIGKAFILAKRCFKHTNNQQYQSYLILHMQTISIYSNVSSIKQFSILYTHLLMLPGSITSPESYAQDEESPSSLLFPPSTKRALNSRQSLLSKDGASSSSLVDIITNLL